MTPSFTPTRHNKLTEVFEAIADLANNGGNSLPALTDVDSDFQAFTKMPNQSPTSLPYPFMFPLVREWSIEDRAMGAGADKMVTYGISLLILVGRSSNNFGPLTDEAEQYAMPTYALYMANRSLEGTVQNIAFYAPQLGFDKRGVIGDITLNSVTHFGLELPMWIQQRVPLFSHL